MYQVEYSERAVKQLRKLDKGTQKIILNWIGKNLVNCSNPRLKGKGLVGNHSGKWRYRIGDYRIITKIQDDKVIILVLEIGHRKNIY